MVKAALLILVWLLLPFFIMCNLLLNMWIHNRQAMRWTIGYSRRRIAELRDAWKNIISERKC